MIMVEEHMLRFSDSPVIREMEVETLFLTSKIREHWKTVTPTGSARLGVPSWCQGISVNEVTRQIGNMY